MDSISAASAAYATNIVTDCIPHASDYGMCFYDGALNEVSGIRSDGGIYLYACTAMELSSITIDVYGRDINGITLDGCQFVTITGSIARISIDTSDTDNNYAGIRAKTRNRFPKSLLCA